MHGPWRPVKDHDHDVERVWTRTGEYCRYVREECADPACRWWRVRTVATVEQTGLTEWGDREDQ